MSITLTQHELSAERLVEELPSPVALKVVALVPSRAAAPVRPPGGHRHLRRFGHR